MKQQYSSGIGDSDNDDNSHSDDSSDRGDSDNADEYGGSQKQQQAATLRCIQHAGDVIFVPSGWAHGVLNLKESVGIAVEFRYAASHFS
jgi:hypothetical protein